MALRTKTIQHAFPVLASMTNNTLTNFTQISVYIPESSVTIKKAWVEVSMDDIITATGGTLTTKTVDLRLGATAYTSTTNSQSFAHTGEALSYFTTRDFTTHFTTNWTGTSMTCDVRLQINQSTGTTLGMVNVCCILYVTYEYDDTSTTQIKSVWIPLNAPAAALPTSKTSHDTIPALDTYLPEDSKTYRNIFIISQVNTGQGNTTDNSVTYELSSLGTHTTANYENGLQTDRWARYIWDITSYITTNTTHSFNVHSSSVGYPCMQAWMVVTYEFDASATTSVMNSLLMPVGSGGALGGTTSGEYKRIQSDFFVQESNVALNKLACYLFWSNVSSDTGLNVRIGTGSFVAYSYSGSGIVAGNKGIMVRNDSPTGITFSRGRNRLSVDIYNTSATNRGGGLGGFWIVNYTSDKHSFGTGAHNHTILWPLYTEDTSGGQANLSISAGAPSIAETDYYISNFGFQLDLMAQAAGQGLDIRVERLSGEGGMILEQLYATTNMLDSEAGLNCFFFDDTKLFTRWPNDSSSNRLPIQTGRIYFARNPGASPFFNSLIMSLNYHGITYSVSGNITNGTTGITTIDLHRYSDGERLLTTTRSGTGSYSFTWYDNTEPVYTVAYQDNTYKGRSGTGVAT